MPAPRLLPANEVLAELRKQGWTYDQIASHFGVTRGAVYLRLNQVDGAVKDRPDNSKLIPWTVATKHAHAFPVQMLRLLGRRQRGEAIPEVKERMLDKWLREIKEADVVVCYDSEYPPNAASPQHGGFYYSRRKPEDGKRSIVRKPEGSAKRGRKS